MENKLRGTCSNRGRPIGGDITHQLLKWSHKQENRLDVGLILVFVVFEKKKTKIFLMFSSILFALKVAPFYIH